MMRTHVRTYDVRAYVRFSRAYASAYKRYAVRTCVCLRNACTYARAYACVRVFFGREMEKVSREEILIFAREKKTPVKNLKTPSKLQVKIIFWP